MTAPDAMLWLCRMRSPTVAHGGRWDHHLQSYSALDATWSQKQAEIEALDAERRQQAENALLDVRAAGAVEQAGAHAESPTLRRALDLVQQVKLDEAEQQSKKAMSDMELASHLAQLRLASDRRQIAVQSVRKPETVWADKESPVEAEAQAEEVGGVVDLLSSSDDEGMAAAAETGAHEADGVVYMLSSDDDAARSEDEEGGTEESDASMSDEGLQIDGSDRYG